MPSPAGPIQPHLGLARVRLLSGAPALAARPTAPRRQLAPCGRSLRSLAPFAMASPSSTAINHDLPTAINAPIQDGAAEAMDLSTPAPGTDSTTSQAPPPRDTLRLHGRGVVAVEGEDLSPLDTDGWKISGKQVSQHLLPPPASGSSEPRQSNRPDRNTNFAQRVSARLTKAARMPNVLPKSDTKIIIRPRGGLNVARVEANIIMSAVLAAAQTPRETAREDTICTNTAQNIIVVSTPNEDRARQYARIRSLHVGGQQHEAHAYRAAPHGTVKGVIRGIAAEDSPS